MRPSLALMLFATACSQDEKEREVDIGNAARAAQGSLDNYVADEASVDTTVPRSTPVRAPVALPPAAEDSAAAALAVTRQYFALIAQHDYRTAWMLWDRDGAASGLSANAFADSFDRYGDYQAEVGTPGRIDSGAGQRYITIPVRVSGTLKDGASFVLEGPVTLHRAGDIDGATSAQRRWRIYTSALRPRPEAATGLS